MSALYIVPADLLLTHPPVGEWHATNSPADPTRSLLAVVRWDNPTDQPRFESEPGVLPLGEPWEPLPPDAAPFLALFGDPSLLTANGGAVAIPTDTAATETVVMAVRKVQWPGARL